MSFGGTALDVDAIVVWRIVDGRISEAWDIPAINTVRPHQSSHRMSRRRRLDPRSSGRAAITSHTKASSGTLYRGTGNPTLAKLATPTLAAVEE